MCVSRSDFGFIALWGAGDDIANSETNESVISGSKRLIKTVE
jgi:hypothetical protein